MNVRQTALESAEQQPATSFAALCKPALLQALVKLDLRRLAPVSGDAGGRARRCSDHAAVFPA